MTILERMHRYAAAHDAPVPRKEDCEACCALRDDLGRMPIEFCDPVTCLVKRWRRGEAKWDGERWV